MATIDLYEAMRTLRAVRRLRPDPIPDDVLYRVLEAASWAPTGGNRQAWRIIVVKDAARKQRLGELYKKITIPYTQSYLKQFADRPEEERDQGRADAARQHLSGRALRRIAGAAGRVFQPRRAGGDRRQARPLCRSLAAAQSTPQSRTCCWPAGPRVWAVC